MSRPDLAFEHIVIFLTAFWADLRVDNYMRDISDHVVAGS